MKRLLSALALSATALFTMAPAGAAVVVSFDPSSSHVDIGGSVFVQMKISGLGDEILSSFDINVLFDSLVVSNFSVIHDVAGQWGSDSVFGPSDFGVGNTGVIDYTLDDDDTVASGQADSFTVLTFGFNGLANGVTTLRLGLDPDFERNFVGRRAQSLNPTIGTACIAVGTGSCDQGTVPEPASWGLAGLALLTAGAARRRRRGDQAA